jgi:hypothetical protein
MSTLNQITKVNLQSLFERVQQSICSGLFVSQPAKVLSYNPTKREAKIELSYILTPLVYGAKQPTLKPNIKIASVIQIWGGNGGLITPVKVGDTGIAIFLDRNPSKFLQGEKVAKPLSTGYHEDCVFLVGLHPYSNQMPTDNQHIYLGYQNTEIRLGSRVAIYNQQQSFWQNMNNTLSKIQDICTQLASTCDNLANAQTIPAVVGSPLTMNPATIASANATKAQANTIKSAVQTLQNNFSQLLEDKT